MKIHCVRCRKDFDSKKEGAKRDSGFETHKCPLCGYENVVEPSCGHARKAKDGESVESL